VGTVALPVGDMVAKEALRNERLYLQPQKFVAGPLEHTLRFSVGEHDAAPRVDFENRIG